MNDRIGERVLCPFYRKIMRSKRLTAVECDGMWTEQKQGFDAVVLTRLSTKRELKALTDVFCCSMFQSCPVYRAIMTEMGEMDEGSRTRERARNG